MVSDRVLQKFERFLIFLVFRVVAAEQFPLRIAPYCISLATASNWLNNFIIGESWQQFFQKSSKREKFLGKTSS
jgi:hypothetical protein